MPEIKSAELTQLEEYLKFRYEDNRHVYWPAKNLVRDLYEQFYIFLGPESQPLDWYPHFIKKLKSLTEGRNFGDYLYYLKTVDFIYFAESLEQRIP